MKPAKLFEVARRRHRSGQLAEAERLYREVLDHDPRHAGALFQLGDLRARAGHGPAAVDLLARATASAPRDPAAHALLGEVFRRAGRLHEAAGALETAIALNADLPEALVSIGLLLRAQGDFPRAVAFLEKASARKPATLEIEYHLAGALREAGALDRAVGHYRRAAELGPRVVEVLVDTAGALRATGHLDEAIDLYRRALGVNSTFALAHNNLGVALMDAGCVDEAMRCYRQALDLRPDFALARSNLVYGLAFHPEDEWRPIVDEARAWQRHHAGAFARPAWPHDNERAPERPLRIGYVSPDFRDHCQAFFMMPLLRNHDRRHFTVVCYSAVAAPDERTASLRAHADEWRDIARMDDAAAASTVRAIGIDILVDLTMHMQNNRLPIFARKPAPVQVCWLAYPGTTGIDAIDYRITDPFLDPPDVDDRAYTEHPSGCRTASGAMTR